jgi:hypothetical protein
MCLFGEYKMKNKEYKEMTANPVSANKWIGWNGGEMPVNGGTIVQVELRCGAVMKYSANKIAWEHAKTKRTYDFDVVKYRVVP